MTVMPNPWNTGRMRHPARSGEVVFTAFEDHWNPLNAGHLDA